MLVSPPAHALVWKWFEGRVLWQVCKVLGHSDSVTALEFSPDGKRVVSGSCDKLVKIWNAETGTEVPKKGLF